MHTGNDARTNIVQKINGFMYIDLTPSGLIQNKRVAKDLRTFIALIDLQLKVKFLF